MTTTAAGQRTVVEVLGLPVDAGDGALVRRFAAIVLTNPADDRCRHIVTLNPEYVMAARRDPAFAQAIADADLVTADGVGIVLAARLLDSAHGREVGRVTGVDLCGWLAELSGPTNAPLFLLGGAPGVAATAADELRRLWPKTRIGGWWGDGTPLPNDDEPALVRIAAAGARVVLVAYGFPGQVTWIERNREALAAAGVRIAVGVGGALDFYAGRVPRAPDVMRRLGLEWLYRLVREPWRWRRQAVLPHFAVLVLAAAFQQRRGNRQSRV